MLIIYIIASNCFPLPMFDFASRFFWDPGWSRLTGAAISALANIGFLACIVSFGNSFRVGIDETQAGELVTTGMYAHSRNPMYVSLDALFFGIFLSYPNPCTLFVLVMILLTFHFQIRNEEAFCRKRYGDEYVRYCQRVRRYL